MVETLRDYLHDALGVRPAIGVWDGINKIPYFLQDAFDIRLTKLLGHRVLLALDTRPGRSTVGRIRSQIEKLREIAELPVIYVRPTLASFERKRLIADKVPFIVPGNQLYLPDLGIDLREYFRRPAGVARAAFSPAAQAILISALLRATHWERWAPADIAAELGYSAMTLSRTVRELLAADVGTAETSAGKRWMIMARTKAATWEHVRPFMRSPVKRLVWTAPVGARMPGAARVAGLSALARFTSIADPAERTVAITDAAWRVARKNLEVLPEPDDAGCEWQIWRYSPALLLSGDVVDPLSLTLSLDENTDDRVQIALDELRKDFPW